MARSKGRPSGGGRRSGGGGRSARPEAAEVAEVEVVEESAGMGMEAGVGIVTFIVLLVALLMVDYDRGLNYGDGAVFSGKYAEAAKSASAAPAAPVEPAESAPEDGESSFEAAWGGSFPSHSVLALHPRFSFASPRCPGAVGSLS